jgi:hypothetical protein
MPTTTFPAHRIVDANSKKVLGLVWWDGEHLRSTNPKLLKYLKQEYIGNLTYRDGDEFFQQLPRLFSGYAYTRDTKVTKDGQEV